GVSALPPVQSEIGPVQPGGTAGAHWKSTLQSGSAQSTRPSPSSSTPLVQFSTIPPLLEDALVEEEVELDELLDADVVELLDGLLGEELLPELLDGEVLLELLDVLVLVEVLEALVLVDVLVLLVDEDAEVLVLLVDEDAEVLVLLVELE